MNITAYIQESKNKGPRSIDCFCLTSSLKDSKPGLNSISSINIWDLKTKNCFSPDHLVFSDVKLNFNDLINAPKVTLHYALKEEKINQIQ